MHLLVFSTYFWPEEVGPAPYVTEPVRSFARAGWTVGVWTGFPHYPEWRARGRRLLARGDLEGIAVHRRAHYVPSSQTAASRALYEGTLLAGALTALVGGRRPDAVLGVTPTLSGAVAARVAAARFRVPFGLLVHDIMGSAAAQSGVAGGARVAAAVQRIELAAARSAARVGIIADGFREYFVRGGVPSERIERLRTWTLAAEPAAGREATRARFGWGEHETVVLHAGNMGQKQALGNVLAAAELLDADRFRVVLAGDGNDRAHLESQAASRRFANVQFLGTQPWGEYEAMLAAADVLVINQRSAVGDMSLPSKLTSYFAAGRATVAAVSADSETAREVEAAGAGLVVTPEAPAALADALRCLADDPRRAKELGESARRYARTELAPDVVIPRYANFLQSLCS